MNQVKNDIDLRRFFRDVKKFWWLYAASFIVLMGLAITYAVIRMPVYESHSTMLIEDSSSEAAAMAAMSQSGGALASRLFSMGSSKTDNEMIVLQSRDVITRTIDRLGLNVSYNLRRGIRKSLMYPSSPVYVDMPRNILDTLTSGYKVRIETHGNKADIAISTGLFGYKTLVKENDVTLPKTFRTEYGPVTVGLSRPLQEDIVVDAHVSGTPVLIENMAKKMSFEIGDKNADGINLGIEDPSRKRGCDILNSLMYDYNAKRMDRRRETAANEVDYCNDRLALLFSQLTESEAKVEQFKRDNNIMAFELDSAGWMTHVLGAKDKVIQQQNELTYYDQVLYTINADKDHRSFLPASLDGTTPNPLIEEYNKLIMDKRELERSATPDNPSMKSINDQIDHMRAAIITSFSQMVDLSRKNLGAIYELSSDAEQKMRKIPGFERELINLLRDRTIKNELYLYLLQRREAAELKLSATDTSGFIIEEAYANVKPSKTKSIIALAVAFILSLLLPSLFVIWYMRRTNTIKAPMDTAYLGIEERTLTDEEGDRSIRRLRTLITDNPEKKHLYVADFSKHNRGATVAALLKSFGNIDAAVETTGSADGDLHSNDTLFTNEHTSLTKHLTATNSLVITEIPRPNEIDEIITLLNANDANLLVIIDKQQMHRKHLKQLLKGVPTDSTIVYILTANC